MLNNQDNVTRIQAILKCCGLFSGLPTQRLTLLASQCHLKKAAKGQAVFQREDPYSSVYVIGQGSIAEFAGGPNNLEIMVKMRYTGDFFGETGILIEEPQLVTAIALEPTLLCGIPAALFKEYLWSETSMTKFLIHTLIMRLKDAGKCQVTFALLSAAGRLACTLLRLEQEEGGSGRVAVTQEYLAQCCGLARQTVARLLRDWRSKEWVSTEHQRITIHNPAPLLQLIIDEEI